MNSYLQSFSVKKKITLKEIKKFGNLIGDQHKLHLDKKYCISKNFDNLVCHGLFISSLCSSFVKKIFRDKSIIIKQSFEYSKPVYVNENIKISIKSKIYDKRFLLYKIEFKITVKNILKASGNIKVKLI